jgi:putative MFS transporter
MIIQDFGATAIAARIDRMPIARWHARLIALLGGAHLFDAFDATALAFVLPVLVGLWHLTPTQAGVLIAASYAGQLIGSVLGGMIAERIGRLAALRLALVLLALGSLACAAAPSYLVLIILRIVQGIGLGGELPSAATYMNEVSPMRYRGRMVVAIQMLFAVGAFGSAIIATLLIPRFGWRSMFVVGAAPILIALLLRRLLPESPVWLWANGRAADAEASIRRIECHVFGADPPPLSSVSLSAPSSAARRGPGIAALLAPEFRRASLSAWVTGFCMSTVGYGLIGWMPTIYHTVYHLSIRTSLRYSVASGGMSLAGAVLSLLLIDRLGRRNTLTLGFAGSAVCVGVLAAGAAVLAPVQVMLLASAAIALLALPLSGFYTYVPELYPTSIRALGMGVASAWIRVASIVGPPIIGVMLSFGSIRLVFLMMLVSALTGAASVYLFGGRT